MGLDYKTFGLDEFHVKAEGDERTIEGYASVFNHKDSDDEIVMPGAFKSSIAAELPLMLYQHKRDRVPGVWTQAHEDSKGLFVKGHFIDSTLGRDVYAEAKSGAIREFSIGYRIKKETYDRPKSARLLHEVTLKEVSLVTFAVNNQARITRVKSSEGGLDDAAALIERAIELCGPGGSDDELPMLLKSALDLLEPSEEGEDEAKFTRTDVERILRKAGISRNNAKGILAGGYTAIATPRKAGEQEHERLVKFINSLKS